MSKDGANGQMVMTSYVPSTCWIAAHVRSRSSNRWRASSNPTVWCWWLLPGPSGRTSSSPAPEIISRNRYWTSTARLSRSRPSVWCKMFWNRWVSGLYRGHGCLTCAKVIWNALSTTWMTWYSHLDWLIDFKRWKKVDILICYSLCLIHPFLAFLVNHSVKVILLPVGGSTTKGKI